MQLQLKSVADLRAELAQTIEELERTDRPLYVTQRGQARAVLLPVGRYEALLERIEYLDDSLAAIQGLERYRAGERGRPLDEVMKELRQRDLARARRRKKAGRGRAPVSARRSAKRGR